MLFKSQSAYRIGVEFVPFRVDESGKFANGGGLLDC
jgi:hypothetical protein